MEIQTHLNSNYQDLNINRIEILANQLTGDLTIEDYYNLETINIASSIDSRQKGLIRNVTFKNLPSLKEISIILSGVESLTFENCLSLSTLRLRGNKITNLNFLNQLKAEKLTYLSIINNNIFEQDLEIFRAFINLETLKIGNEQVLAGDKRGNNQFIGSLAPLSNLTKLKILHISKTNINKGLEDLSLTIEKIYCDGKTEFLKPQAKLYQCSALEEQLKNGWRSSQLGAEGYFSIQSFNLELINHAIENALSNFQREDINSVIRRRANQLPTLAQQEPEISFWTNPATTNKITFWTASVTTVAVIVALIVGIPAYLTLNKPKN